jgi:4,5-DOPA dioxygenase extradiol
MVSAHWETRVPTVNAVSVNDTIHDFRGFEAELYRLRYPAPGALDLADDVADLLGAAGLPVAVDRRRGLDHGGWVPLMLSWPDAGIPVVQLSVQSHLGPAHHLMLGAALAELRHKGVLVIGSGSLTHDLASWAPQRHVIDPPAPDWVTGFADWIARALQERRIAELVEYRRRAPFAVRNHPTEEHLLPLFVALGAGGDKASVQHLHASTTHGVLRMDAFAFGGAA